MIGSATALQRYLPRAGASALPLARRAFLVQMLCSTMSGLAGLGLAGPIGRLLGLPGGVFAIVAITVLLAGNCLCTTAVACLRGTGQVAAANVTSVLGLAVVPVLALLSSPGIESFLVVYGSGMAAVALGGLAVTRPGPAGADPDPADPAVPTLGVMLRYGLRRTPGDMALPALFAVPTFVTAAALPGEPDAGFVGFTTSAVTLICSFFAMLTPVLLPRLSRHRPDPGSVLHRSLRLLPLAAAAMAAVAVLLILVPAPWVVRGFLGENFAEIVPLMRLTLPAAVPLAVFYAVRPCLDALDDAPMTARLVVAALTAEILAAYAYRVVAPDPATAAALGLTTAAVLLGACSHLALMRTIAARAA